MYNIDITKRVGDDMEVIKAETIENINLENLELLSEQGSEFTVYNDNDKVYKIFKPNYKLDHKNNYELIYLSSIKTSRILMPKSLITKNGKLIGCSMEYIKNSSNVLNDKMKNFINELIAITKDIELLSKLNVRIIDINKNNVVYNGRLYLIDPGNYYINYIDDLLVYLDCKEPNKKELTEQEKKNIIKLWNYNKFNRLIEELLFMGDEKLDFYLLRKVIEFFKKEKQDNNLISDIKILQKYFDSELSVKESINKFVKEYIKIDDNERKLIISLYKKRNRI